MGILRETIQPASDLENNYAEISKALQYNDEAAIFTVDGRGDTVSLSYEAYNLMKAKIEILESLLEGSEDIIEGRVTDAETVYAEIAKMLDEKF